MLVEGNSVFLGFLLAGSSESLNRWPRSGETLEAGGEDEEGSLPRAIKLASSCSLPASWPPLLYEDKTLWSEGRSRLAAEDGRFFISIAAAATELDSPGMLGVEEGGSLLWPPGRLLLPPGGLPGSDAWLALTSSTSFFIVTPFSSLGDSLTLDGEPLDVDGLGSSTGLGRSSSLSGSSFAIVIEMIWKVVGQFFCQDASLFTWPPSIWRERIPSSRSTSSPAWASWASFSAASFGRLNVTFTEFHGSHFVTSSFSGEEGG